MKLYTEEQVLKIALQVKDYGYWDNREVTPIELPSDEEIEQESKYKPTENIPYNPIMNIVWIEGAKWMRDKIQGGNNKQ